MVSYSFMGAFHKYGIPNSWMVFVRENPNLTWMMTGGTPMTQETTKSSQMVVLFRSVYHIVLFIGLV